MVEKFFSTSASVVNSIRITESRDIPTLIHACARYGKVELLKRLYDDFPKLDWKSCRFNPWVPEFPTLECNYYIIL